MSDRIMTGRLAATAAVAAVVAWVGAAGAQGPAYEVDPVHSSVMFRIKHLNTSYIYGRFNAFGGSFVFDKADPSKSTLRVEIKTASVDTGNPKRDEHLRGPDFFNVKQFETATFQGTAFKPLGDGRLEVTGDLTINGVTKAVTVPLELTGEGPSPFKDFRAGFEATFVIKRSEFGIKYLPEGLSDEVRLIVSLQGAHR